MKKYKSIESDPIDLMGSKFKWDSSESDPIDLESDPMDISSIFKMIFITKECRQTMSISVIQNYLSLFVQMLLRVLKFSSVLQRGHYD